MSARIDGDTPAGRKAYEILNWAYRDPAGRADRALERISALAESSTGDALREVRDAGTMCSRLAGATISDQAEPISSQAGLP